jgi:hypothetical protein
MKKFMFALVCAIASLTFSTANAQLSGHVEKSFGKLSVWRLSSFENKILRRKHEAFKTYVATVAMQVKAKGVFTPATDSYEAHYTYKNVVVGSDGYWVRIEKPGYSIHFEKSGNISISENKEQIEYHYLDGVNDTATIFGEHFVQDAGNPNSYMFDKYMPYSAYSQTIAYMNRMEKELRQLL